MRYVSIITVVLILLSACKVKQEIRTQQIVKDSIVYEEKLTTQYDTIFTPADSAYVKAYFECDSLGNVLIRELNEEKGKLKVKTIFKNNMIEVLVNIDSGAIIRQAEEEFIKKYNVVNSEINTTIAKKKTFNWWIYAIIGFSIGFALHFVIKYLLPKLLILFKP